MPKKRPLKFSFYSKDYHMILELLGIIKNHSLDKYEICHLLINSPLLFRFFSKKFIVKD